MKKITKVIASMFAFVLVITGAICLTACVKGEELETSKITIDTSNVKVVYFEGENLSTAGLIVNKVFSDGSEQQTQDYVINDDEFTSNVAGQYRIEVKVGNFSKIYLVNVFEKDYNSLFSIAKANANKINNWVLYRQNNQISEMTNSEGYYNDSSIGQEWATAEGEHEFISKGFSSDKSNQYNSFEEAYSHVVGGYEGITSINHLIQHKYRETFEFAGDTQTITREDYTRSNDGNVIYLQLNYTYTFNETGSGNSYKEMEFQLIDNELVLKRIEDLYFNVDGLKLPDIP